MTYLQPWIDHRHRVELSRAGALMSSTEVSKTNYTYHYLDLLSIPTELPEFFIRHWSSIFSFSPDGREVWLVWRLILVAFTIIWDMSSMMDTRGGRETFLSRSTFASFTCPTRPPHMCGANTTLLWLNFFGGVCYGWIPKDFFTGAFSFREW